MQMLEVFVLKFQTITKHQLPAIFAKCKPQSENGSQTDSKENGSTTVKEAMAVGLHLFLRNTLLLFKFRIAKNLISIIFRKLVYCIYIMENLNENPLSVLFAAFFVQHLVLISNTTWLRSMWIIIFTAFLWKNYFI